MNEVELRDETPSAKFRVEMVIEGPVNWIFNAKASMVFIALESSRTQIMKFENIVIKT